MKRIAMLLILAVFTTGCTITVTPIKPTKKVKRGSHRSSHTTRHHPASRTQDIVLPTPPEGSSNIKETWWVENYRKLEEAHGNYTIQDDANIEPLPDGRFKVPDTVLAHYQDLLLAKPSPKP